MPVVTVIRGVWAAAAGALRVFTGGQSETGGRQSDEAKSSRHDGDNSGLRTSMEGDRLTNEIRRPLFNANFASIAQDWRFVTTSEIEGSAPRFPSRPILRHKSCQFARPFLASRPIS